MKAGSFPHCPHCGSADVLPFEEDSGSGIKATLLMVIASALVVLFGYFFFALSAYLYFPIFILGIIVISTRLINNRENRRKKRKKLPSHFMCTECRQFFGPSKNLKNRPSF
ncbi:MAG: hypothetical protein ACM3SY_20675 [Candidatus Omnitrophota bacterium]